MSAIILKMYHPRLDSVAKFVSRVFNNIVVGMIGREYHKMKSNHKYFSANH